MPPRHQSRSCATTLWVLAMPRSGASAKNCERCAKAQESGILARPAVPSPSPELAAPNTAAPAQTPVETDSTSGGTCPGLRAALRQPGPSACKRPRQSAVEPPPAVPEMPGFTVPAAGPWRASERRSTLGMRNAWTRRTCSSSTTTATCSGAAPRKHHSSLSAIMAWQSAQHSTASATDQQHAQPHRERTQRRAHVDQSWPAAHATAW